MAYILELNEIAVALTFVGTPETLAAVAELEAAATKAAKALATALDVKTTYADLQDGRIMAPFYPAHDGQELPDNLKGFDGPEEWGPPAQPLPL